MLEERKPINGQRFGMLTAIERIDDLTTSTGNTYVRYKCRCDCGNYTNVLKCNLTSKHTQSCGCLHKEGYKKAAEKLLNDLTGQQFGELTVVEHLGRIKNPGGTSEQIWKCKCSCGGETTARRGDLINGKVKSCGCMVSYGESEILKILRANNYNFQRQYTFDDLRSSKDSALRYDFGIKNDDDSLRYLIEYDGSQHYTSVSMWGGDDGLAERQRNDRLKDEYCINHSIPLIRLPNIDPKNITIEDLRPETSRFLVA